MKLTDSLRGQIEIIEKTGCWEFTGKKDHDGYGRLQIGGRTKRAHRIFYEAVKGPIAPGTRVRHAFAPPKCIWRACCNPDHMWTTKESTPESCSEPPSTAVSTESLQSRVDFVPESGCWRYAGATDERGCGRLVLNGKEYKAHRFYFENYKGALPPGAQLELRYPEKCIGNLCCNPAHWRAVLPLGPSMNGIRKCRRGHLIAGTNVVTERRGNLIVERCRQCRQAAWREQKQK